jgi:hypothetical protein
MKNKFEKGLFIFFLIAPILLLIPQISFGAAVTLFYGGWTYTPSSPPFSLAAGTKYFTCNVSTLNGMNVNYATSTYANIGLASTTLYSGYNPLGNIYYFASSSPQGPAGSLLAAWNNMHDVNLYTIDGGPESSYYACGTSIKISNTPADLLPPPRKLRGHGISR